MTVRIQVIKVYDVHVPAECDDPIGYVYGLQTTEIEAIGTLIDGMSDNAEVLAAEEIEA